jgi:hypothetical protein
MKRITDERIARILSHIADGETLREVCLREGVSYHSAWKALKKHHSEEYEAAKECGTQRLVDEALIRAMNSTTATAQEDAMFCDYVRWLVERRLSREYGARRTVTIGEGSGFVLEGDVLAPGEPSPSISEYARASLPE